MKRSSLRIIAVGLFCACASLVSSVRAQCVTAGAFINTSIGAAQSGTFTATFDATPSVAASNSQIALSLGTQTAYTGMAAIVRFNPSGTIDARNGGTYAAATTVSYAAGSSYHFRLVVNVPAHTYSIYVTAPGGSEQTLGTNYAFRTEQNTVASLDTWVANADAGTVQVCNFAVSSGGLGDLTDVDIGAPGIAGGASLNGSTYTVKGSGADIWGTSDQFNYAYKTASGDATITARVASVQNTNAWAKSGVMFRDSTAANASFVDVVVTPANGIALQYRNGAGTSAVKAAQTTGLAAPYWVRIVRSGSTFTGYASANGTTWTQLGAVTVSMASNALAGLAVTSHDNTLLNTSTFDNFSVAASASAMPNDDDIGAPAIAGSSSFSGGTYTVKGSGADIWGTSDQFNYAWRDQSGDVEFVARVASQTNTHAWAKAGLMIRASAAANSAYIAVYVTPANGVSLQYRSSTGASAINAGGIAGVVAPYWLKLTRVGDTFTAHASANGTTWTLVGTVNVTLADAVMLGLAVTSHDNTLLNTSTFDNVSIGAPPAPAPDFTLSATPASQTVAAGSATTYTATIAAVNGFSGSVSFSVSGLPSGATGTFSPTSVSGSGTSTLTVSTTASTLAGTSTLTITGTSGTLTHSDDVTLVVTNSGWVHPGVGVTRAMLDHSKAQAAAGVEPWKTALSTMMADTRASLTYTPTPWQTVECGPSSNPNFGCSDERRDAQAAYTQALLWYFTGNQTYANNAIKIMNAWANTLTGGHINSNAKLQAGWAGSMWPRAAEIIRYTNAGWSTTDINKFKNMLATQYLPTIINGGCQNGNWEAVMILAILNISAFNEDKTSWDKGVALWRSRTPAYIYLTTDGPSPMKPTNCSMPSWYGQTTFVDGIAQETCRDFGHCEWGIEALVLCAETARSQGQDLYSEHSRRFLKAYEFHCTYLNGAPVPSWLCGGSVSLGYVQCFEVGYNHLVNRLGLSLPQTAQYLSTKRPTGVSYFIAWETMTHYGQGNR